MSHHWRRQLAVTACAVIVTACLPASPAAADSIRDDEWYLTYLDLGQAHKISEGVGVTVALLDTGVDATHIDLVGNVMGAGREVQGALGDGLTDSEGHGTAMAGLIAGHGHGAGAAAGIIGVAPKSSVLSYQPDGSAARGTDAVAHAIGDAVSRGAKVVNMSFGFADSPLVAEAIRAAERADVVLVAAAGNTSTATTVDYPAAYPGVVAVGAVDRTGDHAAISVTGPEVLLAAPGVDIRSTGAGGGYRIGTGTSDSSAVVSGVVALIRSRYPEMSATEVIHRLTATATDKGAPGRDDEYGYGIVNPVAALTADVPPLSPSPSATASGPTATHNPVAAPRGGNGDSTLVVALTIAGSLVALGIVVAVLADIRRRRRSRG